MLGLCLLAVSGFAAEPAPPAAQSLLDSVVAQLPSEALVMNGDLLVRRQRGVVVRQLGFSLAVHWGARPAVATYTIRDAFGNDMERLTVTRAEGQEPRFQYFAGNPLEPRPDPDLFAAIQGSDVSWMDLALSFLWWRGGTVVKTDDVLGRTCYVVEVPAPPGTGAAGARPCEKMRLWIDKELRMLLQAEAVAPDGAVLRRLWVRSFKRMEDRWMIKDLEVQEIPSAHRTKLTIREVVPEVTP